MATTTNYGWTTPDDTGLVKDGASAIRSLGTSVDTTTKNLNPSTTLGDIEYRSSTANTNTRLGIGSTGQVLTVAGGVPSWAAPAGGAANYTLLNAGGTALTGSNTITVSGISGKDSLFIYIDGASSASANENYQLRFNSDSGSNYAYAGLYVTASSSPGFLQATNNMYFLWQGGSTAASTLSRCFVKVDGTGSAGIKPISHSAVGTVSGSENYMFNGYYSGTSAISSVSINTVNGNFDAGTLYVYGA